MAGVHVMTEEPRRTGREADAVRVSPALVWLCAIVAGLGVLVAAVGLLSGGGQGTYAVQSPHGQTVDIYGLGVYEHDSVFRAAGNRGTDAVTLFVAVPLLVVTTLLYARGSLRGTLVLTGALAWFLYIGVSYAAAVAYNPLFLAYVALFSASLFAFVLAFTAVDTATLGARMSARIPRRTPAVFLFVSGFFVVVVWLLSPVLSLVSGEAPVELETYTTLFTNAFDSAVIAPAAVVAGVLILRRQPLGYVVAVPLVVLEAMLAPMVAAMTVSQHDAGVSFTPGEIVGPIVGFAVLAVSAVAVLVALLRGIDAQ
jgi:hypothetical protein